jgi:prepilin-type processing-associated H-X9-DG protein
MKASRDAKRRTLSGLQMRQLATALVAYASFNGKFPPQYTMDASGKRLHSWRTLILPYAGVEVDVDQSIAWNEGRNVQACQLPIDFYLSPRYNDSGNRTNYVAIAGSGHVFNASTSVGFEDFPGGKTTNTILIVEVANSDIAWAEPRDLTLDELQFESAGAPANAKNLVRSTAVVGYADGHVQALEGTETMDWLRARLMIAQD